MKISEYKSLIYSDFYRLYGSVSGFKLIGEIFLGESYKYIFWMRSCEYLRSHTLLKFSVYIIAKIMLRRYRYRYGISIPSNTQIGEGFYIGHFGGIVVNQDCLIGKNCNISQGVTLGQANRGKNKGTPTIGNNVYIGPGVKVVGKVRIGNNVAIGANSVVTKDMPDNSVVAGVPAKVISDGGVSGYISHIDYINKITGLK
jgi:serine O-acetyltransferase